MVRAVVLGALALGLTGCGGSGTVPAEDVAAAAEAAFADRSGGIEFPVTCPDDVEAEVGARTTCVLRNTTRDEDFDVRVTVTSVDDGVARFDFEFDDRPRG